MEPLKEVLKTESIASKVKTIIWTYKKLCIHFQVIALRILAQITVNFITIITAGFTCVRIDAYTSIHS